MNATFEQGLQAQLDSGAIDPRSAFGKKVKRVLSMTGNRKAKILARMENHSRVHLGLGADQTVNWTAASIDWASVIQLLIKLLPLILAIFGA